MTDSTKAMTNDKHTTIDILLVEDNPADVMITREAFADGLRNYNLRICADGQQAVDHLLDECGPEKLDYPHLVLLDINLPRLNGLEVLDIIKADSRAKQVPVVVLTTSQADEDILASYSAHASCFIQKPVSLEKFGQIVQSIEHFWMSIARLPAEAKSGREPG